MITRETLELAALAAGIRLEWDGPPDQWQPMYYEGKTYRWFSPHTDPGDAARLADKLLMYVDSRGTAVQARVVDGEWHRIGRDGNPNAWCEAVVLCAAAVGEKMKVGA